MLHECLKGYPGAAIELAAGEVVASNGRLESRLGRQAVGHPLESLLEEASRLKWRDYEASLPGGDAAPLARRPVELALLGASDVHVISFAVAASPSPQPARMWLLESYRDPVTEELVERLADVHSELARMHRELERDRARLARALADAEAAVRTRDDVLAVVAHDLRNPLAGISMTVDLLLKTELPPERRRLRLLGIQDAATRIHRLVRDLLEVALLEAGQLSLETCPVDAAALLREAAESVELQAQRRGVSLAVDEPPPDLAVVADRARVQRVLGNLLDNALKHTPSDGRVTLRVHPADEEVRFDVQDTGPGIPADEMRYLFRRFWQSRRDSEGAGLGLAIARGLVEAHGGRISVDSTPGSGSVFSFTLPRAR